MNYKRMYLGLGILVVAIVTIVILLGEEKPATPQQDATAQQQMPLGHPDVAEGGSNAPGKANVRQDFIQELERLRTKIKNQKASDTSDVLRLGRMLADSHMSEEALPLLERYQKAAPANTDVMLDLALVYYNTRQLDKALAITRRTLDVDPANMTAMYNLGALYATQDNKVEAKKAWDKLIARFPNSEDAKRAKEALAQLMAQPGNN